MMETIIVYVESPPEGVWREQVAQIAIIATLDTKGDEAGYLRDRIERCGHSALILDVGVVGEPTVPADISRRQVAQAAGHSLEDLLAEGSRQYAAPIMAAGARQIVAKLVAERKINAIIGLGGTQGTTLCTAVMRGLPYGFPKVMVSTMASGNVAPWVDTKDVTMMFSVCDLMGLNPFTKKILSNAAAAACGMAEDDSSIELGSKPLVAVTTVGITTPGAMAAVNELERAGYKTIVFHAIGTGGRAMEELMEEGVIGAVLDFSLIEISNQVYGGLLAGGMTRLTTAGRLNIPQVLVPGAIEVLVFNEPDTIPPQYRGRPFVRHSPQITDVRLNSEEMIRVAREIGSRLRQTSAPAWFIVPAGGFDCYDVPGEQLYDPIADRAFIAELSKHLPAHIEVEVLPEHINDWNFARHAAQRLIELMEAPAPTDAFSNATA
jgi:uncharacterized protein (UPF0261 family)